MSWWRRLWRKGQMEEQLDKELNFHLEQHAAELIARGENPQEARRLARIALGGPEQVKEECRDARGTRWLEDLAQDFRYAVRTLRQRPGFAAVALLTLALGSGATTVMFTVINSVLLKPLAYPQPDRLVTLHGHTDKFGDQPGISYPDFLDLQRDNQTLAPMAAWNYGGGTLSAPGDAEYVAGRRVSADLFAVLGTPMSAGRAFSAEEDRPGGAPVAIISRGLWQSRFGGSTAALGSSLVLDGKPYKVVGVAPVDLRLEGEADVFTPLGQWTDPRMQNRAAPILHEMARLRPGISLEAARNELAVVGSRLAAQYPQSNAGRSMGAGLMHQDLVSDVRSTLWLLLAAVSFVLLIACVNVASLLLARAVSRERELAMRVALGAGRGRLIRQCLTESALLGLCGGGLGVGLAVLGIGPFVALWPGSLPRAEEVHLDGRVLLFTIAVSVLCGLLFGLAPALRAPKRELEQALRAGARTLAGGSRRLHSGFVISEISLAVVLLVSAGSLGRMLLRLSSLDPGVNPRNVLTARMAVSPAVLARGNSAELRAAMIDFEARARGVAGVQSAALADIIPMRNGGFNDLAYWPATTAPPARDQAPVALATGTTQDYLKVMGIALRSGRFLDDRDRLGGAPVVVIDEVMARHAFGGEPAVGKRLRIPALDPNPVEVIGVVGHVRHWGLAEDDQSKLRDQMYYPLAQLPDRLMGLFSSLMSITIRTDVPPRDVVEALRREERGGDQIFYDVRTMEELMSDSLSRQRFLSLLFGVFAGLALLLACIGIYGVLAYLTSQRVPEIGVRMALGASAGEVMRMVLRQSLGMIVAGAGVGLAASVVAGRVLEQVVGGVRSTDPETFAVMTSVLVGAALLASLVPAAVASRVDPVTALRQE